MTNLLPTPSMQIQAALTGLLMTCGRGWTHGTGGARHQIYALTHRWAP